MADEQITLDYYKGLPRLTVPLPSRKERCRLTLKPMSNTVGDLSSMLKAEDRGIDRVTISSKGTYHVQRVRLVYLDSQSRLLRVARRVHLFEKRAVYMTAYLSATREVYFYTEEPLPRTHELLSLIHI